MAVPVLVKDGKPCGSAGSLDDLTVGGGPGGPVGIDHAHHHAAAAAAAHAAAGLAGSTGSSMTGGIF